MEVTRLGIVEDEVNIRQNLIAFFEMDPEISVITAVNSVEALLEELDNGLQIKQLLLDISLPGGMSGLEGIRHIKDRSPQTDILMLTAHDDSTRIFQALCAGAVAYISKKTPLLNIKEALKTVLHGGSYMSPAIARRVVEHFAPPQVEKKELLTPRQEQIVQGLVEGLSYKMIASKLLISVETVRDHIKKIYKKLEVNSKAEVIKRKLDGEI